MKLIHRILVTLALLLLTVADAVSAPLSAARQKEVVASLSKAAAAMSSMSCDIVQTKQMSLLKDKMVSRGKMYYKKSNKLRWEYTSPYTYSFILNGTKASMKGKNRKDVVDVDNNKVFKEISRIMMSTVTGNALTSTSDFTSTVADGNATWEVTLLPKRRDLRQMFSKIILSFRKSDSQVQRIRLYEKKGDVTTIEMKNIVSPARLNDSLFTI